MLPASAQELRSNATLLNSWKEVAAYLDVTVRTAQKWERDRGLPVQRLPGNRSRVSAHTDQIDRWRDSLDSLPPPETLQETFGRFVALSAVLARSRRAQFFCLLGVMLLSVMGWGLYAFLFRVGPPSDYRLEGRTLIVLDAHGRERWRYALDGEALQSWKQHPYWVSPPWFGDLDGDGSVEFLFPHNRTNGQTLSDQLLCFSEDGKLRWSFSNKRNVRTRDEVFAPPFRSEGLRVVRLGPGKGLAVAVTSYHSLYYPFQVALLSPQGQLIREYWHSGHLLVMLTVEAPGGGRDLLYLGGVSNAASRAAVVILDPLDLSGASREENPTYQLLDFEPPRELARIILPRTRATEDASRFNMVSMMRQQGTDVAVATNEDTACFGTCPTVLFHFSPGLKLTNAVLGDNYYVYLLHKIGRRERLSADEESVLRHVRYLTEPAAWLSR